MTRDAGTLTAELVGGARWRVCVAGVASEVDGPGWPASAAQLSRFADALCSRGEGWAIRAAVFVGPAVGGTGATKVATYPRHVWMLSQGRAVVCSLEDDAQAAVVVDLATGSASVQLGGSERIIADAEPARIAELMRALSITRLLIRRGTETDGLAQRYREGCSNASEIVECGPESVRAGAARFAAGLVDEDGVWITPGQTAVMRCRREISYAIHHTRTGAFDGRDSTLAEVTHGVPVLLVVDRNVDAVHGRAIRAYAHQHLNLTTILTVEACETAKGLDQVEDICRAAAESALPRNGLIVAVGGGITLDMAGLAASMFRRGVGYVRVPTTLVGLVDVSVGIKQGVNAFGRKNILGAFFPPTASVNDYSFIRTSPARSIACGLAEIVKIALVRDEGLLNAVERHGRKLLTSAFRSPAAIVASVVHRAETLMMEELGQNLFETHHARLADFGHTFSPAIETGSGHRIAHGEAVALDMLMSVGIGVAKGLCEADLLDRLTTLLPMLTLPVWDERLPEVEDFSRALDAAVAHRGGNLNLVVPTRAGAATFVQHVSPGELTAALEWMRSKAAGSPVGREEWANVASAGI